MHVSPSSLLATATVSIDLSNGSSCWTTVPCLASRKAMVLVAPPIFSISTPNPQQVDNQWDLSRPGSKNASSGRCCSIMHYTKGLVNSMTEESLPTLPESETSIRWSRKCRLRYVSGKRVWPLTRQLNMPLAVDWKQHGHPTDLLTSRTWDPFGNAGSSRDAVGFPPQHVDVLM